MRSNIPMAVFVGALICWVILSGTTGCSLLAEPQEEKGTVTRVIDGDTIEVSGVGTVRMIGIDTPETVDPDQEPEPYGYAASDFTKQNLEGEKVRLELGSDPKDDYDRTLAYVWHGGELYEERILLTGFAEVLIIEPNDKYQQQLEEAESAAKFNNLGMWQK